MYVLGSIFLDNKTIEQTIGKLDSFDFYDERNVHIYKAMVDCYNSGDRIEVLTVLEMLKRHNVLADEAMQNYLLELVEYVPASVNAKLYIDIVEEKAIERKLLHRMEELSNDILNSKYEFNDMLDKVEDTVLQVVKQRRTSEFITIRDAAAKVFDEITSYIGSNKDITGLDTGYPRLNKSTLGFQKGDLMILAARPAVGKSTYAINLALNVAKANQAHVALFSLEMSIEQLLMRIFSYQSGIDLTRIRNGNLSSEDLVLLSLCKEELGKLNLYFDENSSTNIADIRTKCRQLKQQGKLDFVVIDYLQLITVTTSRGSRQEEVSFISRQLKTLAQELEVPILALSQLSRSVEGREDRRPQLSDLRESGSIEQDADMVMFIYRRSDVEDNTEELSKEEATAEKLNEINRQNSLVKVNNEDKEKNKVTEVIVSIAKNRQGPLATIDYNFLGGLCKFSETKENKPIIKKSKSRDKEGLRNLKAM